MVLFNQFLGFILSLFAFRLVKWRGCGFTASELPTFQWVVFEIAVFTLVEEFGFYYTHRYVKP